MRAGTLPDRSAVRARVGTSREGAGGASVRARILLERRGVDTVNVYARPEAVDTLHITENEDDKKKKSEL